MSNAYHQVLSGASMRNRLQLGRTWRLIWRSAPGWTLLNGLVVLANAVLPLLSLYALKRLVDAFVALIGAGGVEGMDGLAPVGGWILILGGIGAVAALFRAGSRFVVEAQAVAVTDQVQSEVQAKSVEVDYEDFESPAYHDLLQQVQSQATFRPARIARGLWGGTRSLVTGLALGGWIMSYSWILGAVLVGFAVPGILVRLRHAHRLLAWHGRQSSLRRMASYLHGLLSGAGTAKEIRLFGLGAVLRKRAREARARLRSEHLRLEGRRAWLELVPNLSTVAALLVSLWIVARLALQGEITPGDMVVYLQAFQRCQGALSEFLGAVVNFYEDNLFLGILYRFLDLKPRVVSPAAPRPLPRTLQTGLSIEDLAFRYPGTDRDVLRGVNLVVPAGRVMAIVGENGAGKSTLAKLVCRLYDPCTGRIRLDGEDIRGFDLDGWRRGIGVLFQDFNQYNLTARDNIWFGDVMLDPCDGRIETAARRAGIHDVLTGLGSGYDTILGRTFRSGEQLSAGQWQRMALARALVRDCRILVLDEPTSAMDPKMEHEIRETLRAMTAGRTTLLISHRLSTVAMADRIAVLDGGRVAEEGTHAELIDRGGVYADLFERQSRSYREPDGGE